MAGAYGSGGVGSPAVSGLAGTATRRQRVEPRRSDRGALARRLAVADLAEGLAHDLKNQLTVVAASVQLARGPSADPMARDLLDRAFHAAMRAARLLDEMLSYTRSSAVPKQAEADAGQALETAVAGAWSYCSARRVDLEMRPALNLPPVCAPAAALRVLLWRLLCYTADQAHPGARLLAEADVADGGVALYIRAHDSEEVAAASAADDLDGVAHSVERTGSEVLEDEEAVASAGHALSRGAHNAAGGRRGSCGDAAPDGSPLAFGTVEADELSVIQALAAQAGAALRWEPNGAALMLEAAPGD